VAYDKDQLREKINTFLKGELPVMDKVPAFASAQLLNSIKTFIEPDKQFEPVSVINTAV
jgi:hypothetical protein